jgi:hypothetical protein
MGAINEMQGALLLQEFSEDNGLTWKVLVCAQAASISSNTNVTEEKTKCGPVPGIDAPGWTASGDGVANFEPTVDQVSLTDIARWIQNTKKVWMRVQSPVEASPAFALGEKYFRQGQGYISTNNEDLGNGSVVKFSWEMAGSGALAVARHLVAALATPINQAAGTTITIPSVVTGGSTPYTYQWKKGGVVIVGATSATFTKVGSVTGDTGSYTVVVTDAANHVVTSSASVVTIT